MPVDSSLLWEGYGRCSHPLHSLEHNIYIHDLPFSVLSSLDSTIAAGLLMMHRSCRPRTWARYMQIMGAFIYSKMIPTVTSQSVLCSGFTYFSVVFYMHEIYIKRKKQWCSRITVCHFKVQTLLLFNYALVNTIFHL